MRLMPMWGGRWWRWPRRKMRPIQRRGGEKVVIEKETEKAKGKRKPQRQRRRSRWRREGREECAEKGGGWRQQRSLV